MVAMTGIKRPLPRPDEDSEEFWRYCKEHQLRMQCCGNCGHTRFRPSLVCPKCLSTDATWERLSGLGHIYSFVVVHQPMVPGYDEVPYVLALVDVDEGPRMTTRIIGCDPGDIEIGARVQVAFEDVTDDLSLPVFVLVRADA